MPDDFAAEFARLRKSLAPQGRGPDVATLLCADCGEWYKCWRSKIKAYCADCSAERMRRNIAETKGRARQRWLDRLNAELDDLERAAPSRRPPARDNLRGT